MPRKSLNPAWTEGGGTEARKVLLSFLTLPPPPRNSPGQGVLGMSPVGPAHGPTTSSCSSCCSMDQCTRLGRMRPRVGPHGHGGSALGEQDVPCLNTRADPPCCFFLSPQNIGRTFPTRRVQRWVLRSRGTSEGCWMEPTALAWHMQGHPEGQRTLFPTGGSPAGLRLLAVTCRENTSQGGEMGRIPSAL